LVLESRAADYFAFCMPWDEYIFLLYFNDFLRFSMEAFEQNSRNGQKLSTFHNPFPIGTT
jgi:hypothetical protein